MNNLYRKLAPITESAWREIELEAVSEPETHIPATRHRRSASRRRALRPVTTTTHSAGIARNTAGRRRSQSYTRPSSL